MSSLMLGDKIEDLAVGGSILHEMKNDEVHKNVHIKTTDGSIIRAHSVVLAAVSPKFKAVFEERDFGIYNLSTTNVSAAIWRMLLDFLYTGYLQLPNSQNELDTLLHACEALDFIPLLAHLKASDFDTEDETSMNNTKAGGEYMCDICYVDFPSMMALRSHQGHHKRQQHAVAAEDFKCDECGLSYTTARALGKHRRTHHRKQSDLADFDDTESVRSSRKGDEDDEYQCDICQMVCVSSKALAAHKGHHSRVKSALAPPSEPKVKASPLPSGEWPCIYCDKVFATHSALGSHKRIHAALIDSQDSSASPTGASLLCDICNQTFQSTKSLHAHRGHHFRKPTDPIDGKKPPIANLMAAMAVEEEPIFACNQCDHTFQSKHSLQSHMAYHRRTGPICPVCNQKCLNNVYLQRHMDRSHKTTVCKRLKTKGGIVKGKNKSHILGQLSLQKKRIKKLIKVKIGATTAPQSYGSGYECPICARKFEHPSRLRGHLQTDHSNYKNWRDLANKKKMKKSMLPPFWGDYIDKTCKTCDVSFEKGLHYVTHMKEKHNETRPFACNKCPVAYTSKVGMRGHIITAHAPQWKLYPCQICPHVTDILLKARKHHVLKHDGKPLPEYMEVPNSVGNGDVVKAEQKEAEEEEEEEEMAVGGEEGAGEQKMKAENGADLNSKD